MEPSFEKWSVLLDDHRENLQRLLKTLANYGEGFAHELSADDFDDSEGAIRYASKASLIGWKEASVREKDRLDALALRRLQANPRAFD